MFFKRLQETWGISALPSSSAATVDHEYLLLSGSHGFAFLRFGFKQLKPTYDAFCRFRSGRSGPDKLNKPLSGNLLPIGLDERLEKRSRNDKRIEKETFSGIQGKGSAGSEVRGKDTGRSGATIRCPLESIMNWKRQLSKGAAGVFDREASTEPKVDQKVLHAKSCTGLYKMRWKQKRTYSHRP